MPRCPRCHRRVLGARCPGDGTAIAAVAVDVPRPAVRGRTLGRLLGRGGTAAVWELADDPGLAIKVPHHRTDAARERVIAEAAAMRLAAVPPAVRLRELAETTDGRPALVIERLHGTTLAAVIADLVVAMPAGRALAQLGKIAEAVAALHDASLVHRDLKPENVFLTDTGEVRILDLGLALGDHRGPAGEHTQVGAGTLEYASPEQLRGDPVDVRADVYALGAILFELVALRPPFVGDAATIRSGQLLMWPPRLDELVPAPPGLVDLVDRCLRKDPAERPPDARALAAALPAIAGWTPVTTRLRVAGPARTRGDVQVVLLAIEGDASSAVIGRILAEHGGFVTRRRRGFALALFDHDAGSPLDLGLAAANRLVAAGLRRVVVHLAPVQVRPGSRLGATGEAIDHPETWLPQAPERGVVLSASASAARRPARADLPLAGRDAAVAALRVAAGAALAGTDTRPTLIVGPAGSGRSRMLREAARIAETLGAAAIVVEPGPRRLAALARALAVDSTEPLEVMAALGAAARLRRLAVLVDETDPTDPELASALVRVVETTPFWLCIAGDPDPSGRIGVAGATIALAPLDAAAGERLVDALLEPCVVPAQLRRRIVAWGEGLPGVLAELPPVLRAMGVVRPVPGSELWELDAVALERLPPTLPRRWLAERELGALPPALADLARVAAVLGVPIDERELAAVLRELVRAGASAASFVDPGTGVGELARRGLLVPRGRRLAFRGEAHRAAVAAGLAPEFAQTVHAAALAVARDGDDADRQERIALHAGAAAEPAIALAARLALVAASEVRHAHLDVARHATAALALALPGDGATRRRLLLARSRARRMSTRYEAARDDATAALAAARADGARADEVEALLALAAICDQTEQHTAAAALVAEADAVGGELPPRLVAFLHNRRGVVLRRAGRIAEAARELQLVRAAGAEADGDVLRGSLLLLSRVLANLDRSDEGLAVLDEAIARCARDGDHFHHVAGLLNRITFWSERNAIARACADAERGRAIARDMGYVQLAIWIDHNLSIALWWAGDLDGAVAAATRAHETGVRRFAAAPSFTGTIQLATYLTGAGRIDDALPLLDRIRRSDAGAGAHGDAWQRLELACGRADAAGWPALLARAAEATPQDHVEALWLYAAACRGRADVAAARAALDRAAEVARAHGAGLAEVLAAAGAELAR